jgi:hypothetical protein
MCGGVHEGLKAQLEKLRVDAAECALIRIATDAAKRELCNRLADHLTVLVREVERAIADAETKSA